MTKTIRQVAQKAASGWLFVFALPGLIEQLLEIVDKIDLNVIGVKVKLEEEIERFNKFKGTVMGMTEEEKLLERKPDVRNYVKYLLKEGTLQEKRELMQSFKSRLVLLNKRVVLEN